VPIAAITLEFDPLLRLTDDLTLRWQAVAIAAIVLVALILAGWLARRAGLRPDDLLFMTVAAVPGALVGGRLGYVILHLDYYGANKALILDPAQGSLELGLGVVGGLASASYVAMLLGAPIGRWARVVTPSLLLVLGAGKLAMLLGGAGQGQPADSQWAVSFSGPGPWGSLAPELAAHPSQAYEGIATLAVLAVLTVIQAAGFLRRPDGRVLLLGLAGWALARSFVSLTWRDAPVLGGLNAGSVVALLLALGASLGFVTLSVWQGSGRRRGASGNEVDWADPSARPRF
jgi:phosphatidylglycerol---prolipoprotein diacylglyceryl transferase